MPSKGVQAYTYIAVPGCTIELSVPGQTITKTELHQFWNADLEVDAANIKSLFDKSGRFTFRVRHEGRLVTEQWNEINALTGGIDADESTMASIVQTPSVLDRDCIVSYGFYRSGRTGHDLLPARHQCYITVTPPYADWLGRLAPIGSPQRDQPFCRLVLPAAHDVGMNTMANVDVVLRHAGGAVVRTLLQSGGSSNQGVIDDKAAQVLAQLADAVSGPAVAALAPDIVSSLAITQKDSLATMLALGARYFEFRPAFVHAEVRQYLPDKLYFQHSAIPGMAYDDFLNGIVSFLLAHPTEIVVVQLRWDGVPDACQKPTPQQQNEYLEAALSQGAHHTDRIVAGTLADLRTQTIGALRRDRKRLLMLVSVDSVSTYTDAGNATLTGDSIVQGFGAVLHPDCCRGDNNNNKGFINIQCQATASNIPKAVVYSVLEASASNSVLLATKAVCDSKTLPWVRDHALERCGREDLVVLMNDFFDGATADVALGLSRQRLG